MEREREREMEERKEDIEGKKCKKAGNNNRKHDSLGKGDFRRRKRGRRGRGEEGNETRIGG